MNDNININSTKAVYAMIMFAFIQ